MITRYVAKRPAGLVVLFLLACGDPVAPPGDLAGDATQPLTATSLRAYGQCPWGSADCNPCVTDVVGAFNKLSHHGDILGFQMNGAPDVTVTKHWQGVQRLMPGSGRYLAVSRSGQGVSFVVVQMVSRNATGARWRSNRKSWSYRVEHTAPPSTDKIVYEDAGYDHTGGLQALGNVLAAPLEASGMSKIIFYDMATPSAPVRLYELNHSIVNGTSGIGAAATASLTKLSDGRFLFIVARLDTTILDFYVSTTTSLTSPGFTFFATWNKSSGVGSTIGDYVFGKYQNISLVNQCDGNLFFVGTHNNGDIAWQDWADLFRLELDGTTHAVAVTKVGKKHMYCDFNGTNHCNLDAAAGIYIGPDRSLTLYATEHDNDGPAVTGGPLGGSTGSVKLEELRPNPHATTCASISDAWVELFEHDTFNGRSLMIDYVDRTLENESNYDSFEGFEDKTSSAKWCIPAGWRYRLWENKNPCSGSYRDLLGNGAVQTNSDFKSISFGDKVSCSQWLQQ